jgi:hypothetical protein
MVKSAAEAKEGEEEEGRRTQGKREELPKVI